MNTTDSIEREMLQLTPGARAKLVHSLVKSLGNLSKPELESLWLTEAEQRDSELEAGTIKAVPGDKAFDRIRNRHGF